ncbi:M23 family metallopeptidase [Lutibacter sp. A80]|uniref:M23 family metallopeptidase n=1 Tax=Lutibacter sp. A80 TaxID=2918453 RepID=UPI001F06F1CE|nr:M23 family metallopeptidase [Lutibacter sp. A80]UMB61322.1 M23 family metallopeptidase [Lutibacter sp. A80]
MKKAILILFLCIYGSSFSQGNANSKDNYPVNYFSNPLKIPMVLSGTFGELRSNHFHAGLDIKTLGKEGLDVYAPADGYVSRIKVSHWGYGKALYITHPNGYTTVYAHLKKFGKKIEDYVKRQQYKKKSFEIQLFPSAAALPISKNEIIAYSGNTGGSGGPHLHFEIRDSKTEKPINPMLFGIEINDTKKPRINTLIGYSLSENSHINKISKPIQIALVKQNNGDLLSKKIKAFGTIGFGINAYDQLDGAYNKNGLYSLSLNVNGKKVHEFNAKSFSFYESKYINLLIDYERFNTLKQRIQKCFIEPANKLSVYTNTNSNGYITIKDGMDYTVEIIAKDFKGNSQKITIPITGSNDTILVKEKIKKTPYKIKRSIFNVFKKDGITVAFPKYTFYNDFYLDFEVQQDSIVKVHTPTIPLDKKYTLTFDVSKYTESQKKQLYIASIDTRGRTDYETTVKKSTTFYTSTKSLGNFTLLTDNKKPKVSLVNFKNEQWITNYNELKIKIIDNESGIKSYRGEIDGEWILLEYDPKTNLLVYNLNDKSFTTAQHNLKITVTDNVGNSTTLNATFFRKK